MSYAIIRNSKYTMDKLNIIFRHNERKNSAYSNKEIDRNKSYKNYSIKKCFKPYTKMFNEMKKQYNLKGQIKKNSNIVCEYIITSDKEFFEEIGEEETKRYFETAYKFVANYKNLGEQYIVSAKVHLDETTPHLHLVFLPVVHTLDKKSGKMIDKLSCSEFWKGKNSYKVLQDNFYKYMTRAGFELERGETEKNKHIPIEQLKQVTNYEMQEFEKQSIKYEKELETDNIEELKKEYKRVIRKFNTLANQYTKVKVINENTLERVERIERDYAELEEDYYKIEKTNNWLKYCLNKTFECVSILFDYPIERIKSIVNNFIKESKNNDRN
ncbi:MAG: plasmid recombination protein [Clostridia bacterium]|nr:plasmid recombination protein [Clostridia bacterium]